jgi:hypothetical protein
MIWQKKLSSKDLILWPCLRLLHLARGNGCGYGPTLLSADAIFNFQSSIGVPFKFKWLAR